MTIKKKQYCPVCPRAEGELGFYTVGMPHSFVCTDCQFVYSWDSKGKLEQPIKYSTKKSNKCTCPSCKNREFFID